MSMHPDTFVQVRRSLEIAMSRIRDEIARAEREAHLYPPPRWRRAATPEDVVFGQVIWHERSEEDGGDYWHVVDQVRDPNDAFKAYVADDGCRYGLDGAYVEVRSPESREIR